MIPEICKRLKWVRLEAGLNQREFSRRLGFSPSYINELEKGGRTAPSFRFLQAVADQFCVNQQWLRKGVGNPWMPPAKVPPAPVSHPAHHDFRRAATAAVMNYTEMTEIIGECEVMCREIQRKLWLIGACRAQVPPVAQQQIDELVRIHIHENSWPQRHNNGI